MVVDGDAEKRGIKYWLMKAEPESRIVKGKVSLFWSITLIEVVGC